MGHYARECLEKKVGVVATMVDKESKPEGKRNKIVTSISINVGMVRQTKTQWCNAFMFVISVKINTIACIFDPNWILLDN